MRPSGVPVASVILSELHTELRDLWPTPFIFVWGRGVLTPGVQIPHEWWDREQIIKYLEVERPRSNADGLLIVTFRGRCEMDKHDELRTLMDHKMRELLEGEIVPPLLVQLRLMPWEDCEAQPLPPVSHPFGTPVDWEPVPAAGSDLVLRQVADQGMLTSDQLADPPSKPRRPRVRVVDI